jgi:urea transporter
MILGLLFVALVDPAVRTALEILSDEASTAAFIIAVVAIMICQRK